MPELHSPEPLAVSIKEACRILSVGETHLRTLLDDGRLPFSRVPGANPESRGRILIRVSDIDALLLATVVSPKPETEPKRRKSRR